MNTEFEQIRQQQKESWNRFSPGWKKWDELTMNFLKPMGDEIIRSLKIKGDEMVLDIAAGTGEPGLTIAAMLKTGKVVSTDLSEGMLGVATEHAAARGLSNFETMICDVTELSFPDNSFDAVSCRFGFMFFPDMQLAANEMARVLKPGGKISTSVWNLPENNFWVTVLGGTINKNMQLPPPPAGAPGMFRCAAPGLMANLLKQAGFTNITETEVNGRLNTGTPEVYWDMMTEVAAPFVAALNNADENMKLKIKLEVFDLIQQKYPDAFVNFESSALVISGEK